MKPIELTMKNFGPFKKETIDFTRLNPMFLIKGKTGSGKSTIFDAMTYALYGFYSGTRKKLKQEDMRSDFIKPGEESYVEFTFSVDKSTDSKNQKIQKYRIRRTLPTEYITNRGTKSIHTSEMNLDIEENGTWLPIKGRTVEQYTQMIEKEIIGLKYDEFNQIVILPQGEFSKFLKQNSKERDETLKKIFPIDLIEKATEKLREKSKKYSDNLKYIEDRLSEIGADGTTTSKLESEITELEIEIKKIDEESKNLSKKLSEKTTSKAELKTKLDNAIKSEKTKERIKELESETDEINSLLKKLDVSKNARTFLTFIEDEEKTAKRLKNAKSELKETEDALKELEETLSELKSNSSKIEKLEKQNRNDEKEIEELEKKLELLEELSKSKKEKENAESELEDFKKSIANDEENLSKKIGEIKVIARNFDINPEDSNIVAILLEKKHEIEENRKSREEILATIEKIESAEKDFLDFKSNFNDSQTNLEKAQKNFDANKATLEDLEEQQKAFERNNLAATLAKHLKANCACPVCGSIEHPKLAKSGGVSLEDKIDAQKMNFSTSEQELKKANNDFMEAKTKFEVAESKLLELKSSIKSVKQKSEVESELQTVIDSEKEIDNSIKNAKKLSSEIESLSKKKNENQDKLNRLNTNIEKAQTKISEQEKNISGDKNEDSKAVESKIENLNNKLSENKKTVADFKVNLENCEKEKGSKEARKSKCEEIVTETEKDFEEAERALKNKIEQSDFTNPDEIKSQILELCEETNTQERISNWKTELESQKKLFESSKTDEKIEELEEKIEEIENELSTLESTQNKNTENLKSKSGELSTKNDALSELKKLNSDRKGIIEESATYINLAKDLNGENPKKTLFSSWVLAMYFSEVVEYANDRFEKLSGGRYRFKIEQTRAQGKHGLDVAIEDFSTGQTRDSSTLSGGETFQASISLALALTDVVCNHSGGIRLDSLFIDEGFGTLDQESLDKAIQTLKQIQEQRMVGVISHVEAMEVEIKSHIVADKNNNDTYSKIYIENME